jgi:two-component system nitrate/nitrite response regulator NarL
MDTTLGEIIPTSDLRLDETPSSPLLIPVKKKRRETVVVVIRGRLFRDGIGKVLNLHDRVIIGKYETLDQVETVIGTLQPPDLFVVGGIEFDHMYGLFSGIRKLRNRMPTAKWLVLSPRASINLLQAALRSGADGLLLDDTPADELRLAAELILLGHSVFPTALAGLLSECAAQETICEPSPPSWQQMNGSDGAIAGQPWGGKVQQSAALPGDTVVRSANFSNGASNRQQIIDLSNRENEILRCLISGHSNRVIGKKLGITEATVKVHVMGLFQKMRVSNRTQAAILGLKFLGDPIVRDTVLLRGPYDSVR